MTDFFFPTMAGSVGGFAGAFSMWVFSRKKENVEVAGNEISNAKELIDMYRTLTKEVAEEMGKTKELLREQQAINQHFSDKCQQIKICRLP